LIQVDRALSLILRDASIEPKRFRQIAPLQCPQLGTCHADVLRAVRLAWLHAPECILASLRQNLLVLTR